MFLLIIFIEKKVMKKKDGLEKCYCSISFLKPATNWSIIYKF